MSLGSNPKRIIGLTGGIGTGKSTVAEVLIQEGIPVADADLLARQAVDPGSPILERIRAHFGAGVMATDGGVNRRELGRRVFADPLERAWLEAQIHPFVRAHLEQFIQAGSVGSTRCVMIPLLFEAHMTELATEIWVVACTAEQQWQRLRNRDGLSDSELHDRIHSQWPLDEKIRQADVVLNNDGDAHHLKQQVLAALAGSR